MLCSTTYCIFLHCDFGGFQSRERSKSGSVARYVTLNLDGAILLLKMLWYILQYPPKLGGINFVLIPSIVFYAAVLFKKVTTLLYDWKFLHIGCFKGQGIM